MSEAGKDSKEASDWDIIGGSIAAVLVLAAVVYGTWWCAAVVDVQRDFQKAASLGDALGPATGFMSTIALIAAIVSVFLQRRELQLQRKEMSDTRAVLAEQKAEQARLAEAQATANTLSEKQLLFERERLDWHKKAEEVRHTRELLHTEATLVIAVEYHRQKGGPFVNDHFEQLDRLRELVHQALFVDNPFIKTESDAEDE